MLTKIVYALGVLFLTGWMLPARGYIQLVTFSRNRPLQLEAHLRSVCHWVTGVDRIDVLYRTDPEYQSAYQEVQNTYPHINFVAESSFKKDLLDILDGAPDLVIFAVDDNIVVHPIDLQYCTRVLEQTGAYGYYLRLGGNINHCYMLNKATPPPPLQSIDDQTYLFEFRKGQGDWDYPHTLDMTLYRWSDIKSALQALNYTNPNTLEGWWASRTPIAYKYGKGLCPRTSVAINLPLNIVQKTWVANRHENSFSTTDLLTLFNQGFRMNINDLYGKAFPTVHVSYKPSFILVK